MDWLKDVTWLHHLNEALVYIEAHLDGEISIEEAARTACCSTYYFQRVFSYAAGVPAAEYIRRRRMSKAAAELQQEGRKVIEVAVKYGYASPTAFNRAFQSVYGMSPAAAKQAESRLEAYPRLRLCANAGSPPLSCRIVREKAIRLAGVRTPMWEDMERNMQRVPLFWKQVRQDGTFSRICRLSGSGSPDHSSGPGRILGVSVYRNPREIFYYIAAAVTSPVPSGMHELEIPAATWAVFENDGSPEEDVQNTFRRFWSEWLPGSGYDYACLPDIEVYPVYDKKQTSGHSEVRIALNKIKKNT